MPTALKIFILAYIVVMAPVLLAAWSCCAAAKRADRAQGEDV